MAVRTWNTPVPKMTEPEYIKYNGTVIKVSSMDYHEEGTYCLNGIGANGKVYSDWWMDCYDRRTIATKADFDVLVD